MMEKRTILRVTLVFFRTAFQLNLKTERPHQLTSDERTFTSIVPVSDTCTVKDLSRIVSIHSKLHFSNITKNMTSLWLAGSG